MRRTQTHTRESSKVQQIVFRHEGDEERKRKQEETYATTVIPAMTKGHRPQNMVSRGDHTQTLALQKQAVHYTKANKSTLIQQTQTPIHLHYRIIYTHSCHPKQLQGTGQCEDTNICNEFITFLYTNVHTSYASNVLTHMQNSRELHVNRNTTTVSQQCQVKHNI